MPAGTRIGPIRSDPTGMDTGMTCAWMLWHGWNALPVHYQKKSTGAYTCARVDTRGYLASPILRYGALTGHGYDMVYQPVITGIHCQQFP